MTLDPVEPAEKLLVKKPPMPGIPAWIELLKLRMVAQILVTTLVGFYMGAGLEWQGKILSFCLLGTGLLAAAAFALNQAWEFRFDGLMERTVRRPIPTKRIKPLSAYVLGTFFTIAGGLVLFKQVNAITSILGIATVILYVLVYTPMKRWSSLNTLVGAIPGALPPLMGWTAATGRVGFGGLVLFLFLFFWQLPHFLALAWMYRHDYARGGFVMLSLADEDGEACFRQIWLQTLLLTVVSVFPFWAHMAGPFYLGAAILGGGYFLLLAYRLQGARDRKSALALFLFSITYLPVLLLIMAINKTHLLH